MLLLPVYTRYIAPAGFGRVELLANGVIFVSIFVRFGIIEAFLRFYFIDEDPERRDALARRATLFLLLTTTVAALAMLLAAVPLARLVLGGPGYTGLFRIAVLGLWSFTNLELAYGLLRVDERIRTYAIASLANVLLTILSTVILVVVLHRAAEGYLLGNYAVSTLVLLTLWWSYRHRLRRRPSRRRRAERLGEMLRFGLPTVPAELSVYALSIVDRYYLLHTKGAGPVGLYSIAVKLAGSVAFIVRAFQYAWPPLAYSITDDAQAARFYSLVTTYYVVISGWAVAGLALGGRWILRLLAAPEYAGAHRALPWLALGWAMYGLWVVFLVIAGRVGATRRNFPAALAGLVANIVLIVVLVGPLGIAGAGIALCGAYLAMLSRDVPPHPARVRGAVRVGPARPCGCRDLHRDRRRRAARPDSRGGRAAAADRSPSPRSRWSCGRSGSRTPPSASSCGASRGGCSRGARREPPRGQRRDAVRR